MSIQLSQYPSICPTACQSTPNTIFSGTAHYFFIIISIKLGPQKQTDRSIGHFWVQNQHFCPFSKSEHEVFLTFYLMTGIKKWFKVTVSDF